MHSDLAPLYPRTEACLLLEAESYSAESASSVFCAASRICTAFDLQVQTCLPESHSL